MEVAGGRRNAKNVDGVFKPDYLSNPQSKVHTYIPSHKMYEKILHMLYFSWFLFKKKTEFLNCEISYGGKRTSRNCICLNTWISLHMLFVKNKILDTFEVPLILFHSLFPQKVFFTFTTTCDYTCVYMFNPFARFLYTQISVISPPTT